VKQRRKFVSAMAALALVLVGLMTAAPAQAASIAVTVDCAAPNLLLSSNNFGAGPTDTIVVLNSSGGDLSATLNGVTTSGPPIWNNGTSKTFTVVSAAGGTIEFQQNGPGGAPCVNASITLTFVAGGGGSSPDSSPDSSSVMPFPIMQQFGKPASGSCDAAALESLNWSGGASGGWGESWAQWMNDGNGGSVWTRTLVYSNALGQWVVG